MNEHAIERYEQVENYKEMLPLPRSVRERLEQAQDKLASNQLATAEQLILAAETELARSHPETYLMLQAMKRGYQGIEQETIELNTHMQRVERRICGIVVGEDWVPHTTVRRLIQRKRFF